MKRILLFAGLAAMLASCSKEPVEAPAGPSPEPLKINLASFTYEGLMTELSERTSLDKVILSDGTVTRTVSLTASDDLDPDQASALVFNSAEQDSVDLTVTPSYVAIRMSCEGRHLAWIAYGDPEMQAAVEDRYASLTVDTKSGTPVFTRSGAGGAMSLDLTAMAEAMSARAEASEDGYTLPDVPELADEAATRGLYSDLFSSIASRFRPVTKAVVKTPTVNIYLLKEQGANPATHEMNWQVNDAIKSLKDVEKNVKFNVHIQNVNYKGTSDANYTLTMFDYYIGLKYKGVNGIFVLCRWGGWKGNTLGMSNIGAYAVDRQVPACVISCTNAWNKHTMAHEIGHSLGAQHVKVPWYKLIGCDLMNAASSDWLSSGKHKDKNNRAVIKRALTPLK